tara:strand:- start:110 stop:634 length:525 start_codon:yes stop_codon:yes gene_type:complete
MNNNKMNNIPKCATDGCDCGAAVNKNYPNSEVGQHWLYCEKCYEEDQEDDDEEDVPEECNCTPREMLGTSWWKQMGYGSPCRCAEALRDKCIDDLWETVKENIIEPAPRHFAEHVFNIATCHNALMLNYHRRPYRRGIDAAELLEAVKTCGDEFGVELTRTILPQGVVIKDEDE